VLVAKSAWRAAVGGFICAGALNVGTLAVATARRHSTRKSMPPKLVTQSSQASNRFRAGFMITKDGESFEASGFSLHVPTLKTSRRRAQPAKCLRIGSRS